MPSNLHVCRFKQQPNTLTLIVLVFLVDVLTSQETSFELSEQEKNNSYSKSPLHRTRYTNQLILHYIDQDTVV